MPTPNFSELVATTIEARSSKVADNISNNNALLRLLNKRGNVRTFSGGTEITENFSFDENPNAGWYSGYDTLPTNAGDTMSTASFGIKQQAIAITFSGLEMLQNAGDAKIVDLVENRIMNAERTMKNRLCAGLYSDGTGNDFKQVDGLSAAIPLDPTQGTYGSIDRAAWPVWRPQARNMANANTLQADMNKLWASLVRYGDQPDCILMDNLMWNAYLSTLQNQQRFTNTTTGDAGFQSLKFMNADVILDGGIGGNMPVGTAYFLNLDFLHFRPHAMMNMHTLDPKKRYSTNQDAEVQFLGWAGNLTCSGQKFHGILDINA